ncbi:hypothetical protein E1B28_004734 [Marasmius oreades]|uniref:Uncharacterized protein n=1 Tax=Marasmius oreades TaxID=181124 RepID=A0A9P7UZ78_9AGAR|nr:uncharacterized protein E1B28_004734 [Marasmius oreades]KAG7097384.1 hypothetical protein E1B28_004734 [Marasmius oreades]
MNVHEQIEQQSQETKPRRSKSITGAEKLSISRTSSGEGVKGSSSTPPSRVSSEGSSTVAPANAPGSRTSLEKAKSKKFGRSSGDRESSSVNGHKRSESTLSDHTKQAWVAYNQFEDVDTSLQDFDDLMRSDATMKVSLTPDRLKTMEVYKQEKDQRGNSKRGPDSPSLGPRTDGRRPPIRNVDSILEDEEEGYSKPSFHNSRTRQSSVTSIPAKAKAAVLTRTRSTSVSGPTAHGITRKSSKSETSSHPPPTMQTQSRSRALAGGPLGFDTASFPTRTRKIQHNRESLDLDEVMAGSDGEDDEGSVTLSKAMSTHKQPLAQRHGTNATKVSANTRELMDFLNEGPPETPKTAGMSKSGRELMVFLDNGPPDSNHGLPPITDSGRKGSGRLQRMMSKLSMGGTEKDRLKNTQIQDDTLRKVPPMIPVISSQRNGLSPQSSAPNLSMLANRPVPPRPPQPQMVSPPTSPKHSLQELPITPTSPSQTQRTPIARKLPSYGLDTTGSSTPAALAAKPVSLIVEQSRNAPLTSEDVEPVKNNPTPLTPPSRRSTSKAAPPSIQTTRNPVATDLSSSTTPSPVITTRDLQELRRHISRATNPDECRLVMDVFLSKAGVLMEPVDCEVPYPSPSNTEATRDNNRSVADAALEVSLVELFLGEEIVQEASTPRKKKYHPRKIVSPVIIKP